MDGEEDGEGDSEEFFVLLEAGEDESPVVVLEFGEFSSVQLAWDQKALRIADKNGSAGGEGEEVGAGIGGGEGDDSALVVKGYAVEDDKSSSLMRIARHK